MAFVVGSECIKCKYGDCVDSCPVSCFYEGADQLFINPKECIDCEACVPRCPVRAIKEESDATDEAISLNERFDYSSVERLNIGAPVTHGPNYDPSKSKFGRGTQGFK